MRQKDIVWVDLTCYWDKISWLAKARDSQKLAFKSTKNWSINSSTHFIGLCGEVVFSIKTGLRLDTTLKIDGDGGHDFSCPDLFGDILIDVKSSTYFASPDLREFIAPKFWSDIYEVEREYPSIH